MRAWWKQVLLSVGSAAGAAMLASIFVAPVIVAYIMGILIVHEYGHYWAALLGGAEPELPIFLPLGVLVIGMTRTRKVSHQLRKTIAGAGPSAALYVTGTLAILGVLLAAPLLITLGSIGVATECIVFIFGSDGRIIRAQECDGKRWRQGNRSLL